jgi:hypothetical protein
VAVLALKAGRHADAVKNFAGENPDNALANSERFERRGSSIEATKTRLSH